MRALSNIISVLLHPIIMPTLGLLILFNSGTYLQFVPYEYKRVIFLIVIIITGIMPVLLMPLLRLKKMITSYKINERSERIVPMFFTTVFYAINIWYLHRLQAPVSVELFYIGVFLSVLASWIISYFWKISAHMVGIGGIVGLIIVVIFRFYTQLNFFLICAIIAAGLIGTARLYLKEHTAAQVYLGFLLGVVAVILPFVIYW
ncbi:MAG: hypothetical protein JXA53_01075 [Bacteroidales bacterium]|nr:hypothetical protein [Bacteroidales bacterium]